MPSIVQFLHPGSEHVPDNPPLNNHKDWNCGDHRRKFLKSVGHYVSNGNLAPNPADLVFWGEWEPPSMVQQLIQHNQFDPIWLHSPYIPNPIPNDPGLQNTDPYVFDGEFKYLLCQQFRNEQLNLSQLANLDRGSLILFGSVGNFRKPDAFFQLDTVFVVTDYINYNPGTNPLHPPLISNAYFDIVYSMAYFNYHPNVNLRLYKGATFEHQFGHMYSFVPARIYDDGANFAFPRVPLQNLPYINNNKSQGFKITNNLDLNAIRDFWEVVLTLSEEQYGCVQAVRFL